MGRLAACARVATTAALAAAVRAPRASPALCPAPAPLPARFVNLLVSSFFWGGVSAGPGRYGEFKSDTEVSVLENPIINEIAKKHGKSAASTVLRWHIQGGIGVPPFSLKENELRENLTVGSWYVRPGSRRGVGEERALLARGAHRVFWRSAPPAARVCGMSPSLLASQLTGSCRRAPSCFQVARRRGHGRDCDRRQGLSLPEARGVVRPPAVELSMPPPPARAFPAERAGECSAPSRSLRSLSFFLESLSCFSPQKQYMYEDNLCLATAGECILLKTGFDHHKADKPTRPSGCCRTRADPRRRLPGPGAHRPAVACRRPR